MVFLDSVGGGAWPILVGGLTCLVNFDNERDPSCLVAYTCLSAGKMFLNGPSVKSEGSDGLNQVCDAL